MRDNIVPSNWSIVQESLFVSVVIPSQSVSVTEFRSVKMSIEAEVGTENCEITESENGFPAIKVFK